MNADLDLAAAEWVKSSYSGGNGGDCLEFSRSFLRPADSEWVKSSYSGGNGGQCLEFSRTLHPTIPVRDSKATHDGLVLRFAAPDWATFVGALKSGDLSTH
ncbi:DUF397 domain-containing protein [Streptomyces sp. 6N223]|uniref:DUF397 domain-containing protein n=1 Tax=Streptomyces sp. 6N223 TaxID=3457412 RepID=UPI003FD389D0